jgi:hypothetical protein
MKTLRLFSLVLLGLFCTSLFAQQQGTGYIKTKINPGRAGVFVDGKYVGPAANFKMARKYSVAAGEHEIKLIDPRYEEMTVKATVQAGKTTTIKQSLKPIEPAKPPFGRVRTINPDKFAAVYVNGKYFGHVDEFNNSAQGILLNPGEYEIRIEPVSGAPVVQKIKVEADRTVIVK